MFYILYAFLYLLSLLPLKVLYVLSDLIYVIVYYIVGYRKNIVLQNLKIAFPKKSDAERKTISKKFYRNFTDTLIETMKLVSADQKFVKKHFKGNDQIFHDLFKKGKSCQVHLGHNFNWELGNLWLGLSAPYLILGVYMPLKNKAIDRLFRKIRSKSGTILLPATSMRKAMLPYRNTQYLLGLVADQSPGDPANAYWIDFFGRPTPFVKGPEKGALVNDAAVIFCNIIKEKRGYYRCYLELATTEPHLLEETTLTRNYASYLERVISDHPEMWLWSHRRWKHEWKPEYSQQTSGQIP